MKPIYKVTETTTNYSENNANLQLVIRQTFIFGIELKRTQRLVEFDSNVGRFVDYGAPTPR